MFTDSIFRIALGISLIAHLAVIVPLRFLPEAHNKIDHSIVDLSYIVIEHPLLTDNEEIYSEGAIGAGFPGDPVGKEDIVSLVDEEQAKEAFLRYYNLIREKVRAGIHPVYEKSAKGAVMIKFTLGPMGRLLAINDVTSDASLAIRQKTIRGVRRAGPFPRFPEEMGTDPITFSLTVKFAS